MKILITNDDGYNAKGIRTLVKILRPFGDITVVAPKKMQSGMSMAVNLGQGPLATRKIKDEDGVAWWYLDGTPSSCVKLGIDNIFYPEKPDVVVSGINHGGNYGTAYLYSGTIGAACEAALAYIPAIAVSQDAFDPDADFSAVEKHFPASLAKLERAKPVYKEFPGWKSWKDSEEMVKGGYAGLPENMRKYIEFIEEYTGIPADIVSIGPKRSETIDRYGKWWN